MINCKEIQLTAEAAFKNVNTGHPKLKKLEDSNVNKSNDSFMDIMENQFIYK